MVSASTGIISTIAGDGNDGYYNGDDSNDDGSVSNDDNNGSDDGDYDDDGDDSNDDGDEYIGDGGLATSAALYELLGIALDSSGTTTICVSYLFTYI